MFLTKRKIFLSLLLVFCLTSALCTITVFAHSGNTDGNGGHYNHFTGEYHYHHGKPAHEHPNGICPYAENPVVSPGNDGWDGWLVLAVILGFPVVVIVVVKICVERADAKKRAAAIIPDFKVWFSPTGTKYHSSRQCTCLRNAKNVQWATDTVNTRSIYEKTPCSKCCYMENGKAFAKVKPEPAPAADITTEDDIKMYPIASSNLESVGYRNGTLLVHFRSGGTYRYTNVPANVVKGLLTAPSAGKYYNAYIRDRYDGEPFQPLRR